MIVFLSDTDGDDVAIDARQIVAVTVGEMRKPALVPDNGHGEHAPHAPLRVTLIHTTAGPIVVSQSLESVVDAWQAALRASDALAYLDRVIEEPADAS